MRPNTLRLLRRYHQYLGLFFAPWIILFSVSGALQTFRLNEAQGAPQWMVWLSAVHKDQGPPRERKAKKPEATRAATAEHDHDAQPAHGDAGRAKTGDAMAAVAKRPNPLPLKIFVVLLSIALILSSLIGIVIALANRSARRVSIILLVLGTVTPAVLLWL